MKIGIDLSATNIRMGIVDAGQIFRKIVKPFPYKESQEETLIFLRLLISGLMNSNIKGIGIGVPGFIDPNRGIIHNSTNIPSWKELYLKNILQSEFNVSVDISNDSNCFAFGERYYGEGTSYRNIVGLILGIGVGAGIIINDELYEGHNTGAGEIGSLSYRDHDYEYYCSTKFFSDHYQVSVEDAYRKAIEGNKQALSIWHEFGLHLSSLIKLLLYTYDPQAIILGGELSKGSAFFLNSMHQGLSDFLYPETVKRINIIVSKNEDIGLFGASALVS